METYNFTTQIQTAEQFKALKAFMKALEIKFKASKVENNAILTQEQKDALDVGLNELDQGKGIPHETVMTEFKQQYPKYFK